MKSFIDTLLFLREIDTAEEQLNENRNIRLGKTRYLVSDEFKIYYKPSDIVLNYIDSLLKADEANIMNKRCELNWELKSNTLLLSVSNFLIDWDIL